MKGERPTMALIDLAAIAANYQEARRLAGGRDVIGVVKADAYGHGAVPVARRLVSAGCARLAVMTVAEVAELRGAALTVPILLLGGIHDAAEAADVAASGAIAVVQHESHVTLLAAAARERNVALPVQVEVDTGMRRMGIAPEDALSLLQRIHGEPHLRLDGVYTHCARADEEDLAPTRLQLEQFAHILREVRAAGIEPGQVHVANSATLLASEALAESLPSDVNAVRPGLMLYGVSPAPHLGTASSGSSGSSGSPGPHGSSGRGPALRPAMTLRTRVANLRRVAVGDSVGYGGTWCAEAPGRVATLPIGYADGVPWSAGNRGVVLHRGRRVPMAGRISMDLVTLDLGDGEVELGDEVVIFGTSGGDSDAWLPVEELAAAAGTIPYEVLVRVGRRVPRVLAG